MKSFKIFAFLLTAFTAVSLFAETHQIQGINVGAEGVHYDIRGRAPLLTVEEVVTEGNVKLLAHVFVESKDANLYPVVLKFYINGLLFAEQITSITRPRPVGVDIGADVATVPFDYTVTATVEHPNRSIISVIEDTAFGSTLDTTLDCTLTLNVTSEDPSEFTADNVSTTQKDDDSFDLVFNGLDANGSSITVTTTVDITEGVATALLDLSQNSLSTQVMTSGTATIEENALVNFELASETGTTTLSCF